MTVIICITWLVLIVLTIMAFSRGKIFNSEPEIVLQDTYIVSYTPADAPYDVEKQDKIGSQAQLVSFPTWSPPAPHSEASSSSSHYQHERPDGRI